MVRPAWIALARIADIGAHGLAQARRRLGPQDRRRYAAFGSAKRRREFLAGRWLLRVSASARGDRVRFDSSPLGGVAASGARLAASVSHAGGWVACALLEGGAVGVDLEPMVERDFAAAGRWAFDAANDSPREFYARWTRYEARLKARRDHDAGYRDVTYCLGGIALSACLPCRIAVRPPRRWRRRSGFAGERS